MFIERRNKEDNYYKELQTRTLDAIQRLSGNLWTDFNAHDPGITIADAFNYALYELHYTFQFPFESYLNFEFFSSATIFSECIVTMADYERLITTNIAEVEACNISLSENMIYNIALQLVAGANQEKAIREAESLYHNNRNLCEHLGGVVIVDHIGNSATEELDIHPKTLKVIKEDAPFPKMSQAYYSIQHHFPDCYRLREKGNLQLKGYLQLFDDLLADAEQQAKNIGLLLNLSKEIPETNQIHSNQYWHTQKSRFFDMLDAVYGENTQTISKVPDLQAQHEKRANLISAFPELNRNRFRSFNILDAADSNIGIKQTISALLGYNTRKEIPLSNYFAAYGIHLLNDPTFFIKHKHRLSVNITDVSPNLAPEPIQPQDIHYKQEDYEELSMRISLLWHNVLYEAFLVYGANINNYKLIDQHEKGYLLVFNIPKSNDWLLIARFYEKEALEKTANLFCAFIKHLNIHSHTFYLIEHILLHHSMPNSSDYNRLSIVIPRWTKSLYKKKKLEQLFKSRLPAHIQVEFIWFPIDKLFAFEHVYYPWRKAMANSNHADILHLSKEIKEMLGGHDAAWLSSFGGGAPKGRRRMLQE